MITFAEFSLNFKKIVINLFIFLCISFSSYVYATDYTISNGTTQTSRVTLTNNDTLTVDAGGEIDYTWPAVDADNRTFPSGTTTITNNGTIEGSCCVIDIRSSTNPKLINNGTINGKTSSRTIYANNSVNAVIINNGDITILESNDYEAIDGDSSSGMTITNNNGATISSAGDDAIAIEGASNVTITNAGTISSGADWGIQADGADGLTINNSGTISAALDYAIYLRNADNVSITNSGTITSAEDPINMQSSTGTVSITNSGTISQTGGGYNDGLTLQDNATFTNTGTLTASRYAIGGSSSGVTIVNKGTITGGTYDFYVPSMTITTLTNGQGASDALVYRGKMPTNYKLFVASASSYGKFAKEWGTTGTTTFSIDTASTLAANTYTDVFTNTTSARFAGGLTGTCTCSNGVFTWTLSDANGDDKWDLAIAADTTKPTTTFSPVNGATSVAVDSNITLTFNEAVRLTNDSALDDSNVDALITLKENNSSGSDIAFDATINGGKTVITINPSSDFSSEQVIYVAIGTSVEDTSNNAINAASVTFTAVDNAAPTTTFSPLDNATSVAVDSNITLTFNEAVRLTNDSALDDSNVDALITLKENNSSGSDIAFDATINGGKTVITINPSSDFSSEQVIYVAIGTSVEDDADNAINAASVTFTAVDTSLPTTTFSPLDNATSVAVDSNITLTFNEAVRLTNDSALDDSNVDALITLKENNSSGSDIAFDATINGGKTVITINPSSDFSSEQVIYVAIGATVEDDADNAINAANVSFTAIDNSSPTMTITSSTVSDGDTSDDSTLSMTFTSSEATTDFVVGDITVTGGSLSSFASTSSTIYTATFTPTDDGATTIDVASSKFTDATGNDNVAATQFNWTYESQLPSPLDKPDVTSSVEAAKDIAAEWADMIVDISYNRIAWLGRNQGSIRTSHQGIRLRFQDEMIDILMNSSPNSQIYDEIYFANKMSNAIENTNGSLLAVSDHIKSDATTIAINEGVKLRALAIETLNPTFEPIFGDWSIWTKGELIIGKTKASSTTSKQDTKSKILSLGFDRPLDDEGIVGFVFDVGRDNTDIGSGATNVKSKNYSLSNYSALKLDSNTKIETVVGISRINFDMIRTDGSETLLGERRGNQLFLSNILRHEYKKKQFEISPYLTHSATLTNLDAFSESSGSLALTFNKQEIRDYEIGMGMDINSEIILKNSGRLKPFTRIEYNKSNSKTSTSMFYTSEGASNTYVKNFDIKNNNWKLRVGIDHIARSGWRSSASYTRKQAVGANSESKYSNSFTLRSDLRF